MALPETIPRTKNTRGLHTAERDGQKEPAERRTSQGPIWKSRRDSIVVRCVTAAARRASGRALDRYSNSPLLAVSSIGTVRRFRRGGGRSGPRWRGDRQSNTARPLARKPPICRCRRNLFGVVLRGAGHNGGSGFLQSLSVVLFLVYT